MSKAVISYNQFFEWFINTRIYLLTYNGNDGTKKYRLLNKENITEVMSLDLPNDKENTIEATPIVLTTRKNEKSLKSVVFATSLLDTTESLDTLLGKLSETQCTALCAEIERCYDDPELNKIVRIGPR